MCTPSANSAIEPNTTPAAISKTMNKAVRIVTSLVRDSARSCV